ncbi:ankyrin repeat-containing domain protein, partial [Morchella snyderi]
EIANMLLDAGADTNLERTMTGDTALHLATCKEILPMVVNLISAGADIEATDLTGCTALHIAARNGNLSVFNAILNGGGGGDNAPLRHITALHYSSWHGHIKIVESLICRDDIAVNATDSSGTTALHYGVKQRDIDIVRVLL